MNIQNYEVGHKCDKCFDSGTIVDLRRDEEQETWLWSNERPCPDCHNFSNSHTINKLGTLDSVLECEDCGLRIKENVGHTE